MTVFSKEVRIVYLMAEMKSFHGTLHALHRAITFVIQLESRRGMTDVVALYVTTRHPKCHCPLTHIVFASRAL